MVEVFEFVSKYCKMNNHQDCAGAWQGLGIEVNCTCRCEHKKYAEAVGRFEGQGLTPANGQPS